MEQENTTLEAFTTLMAELRKERQQAEKAIVWSEGSHYAAMTQIWASALRQEKLLEIIALTMAASI